MERYSEQDKIGQGAFGMVWLCRRRGTKEKVAVKKISKVDRMDSEITRLKKEFEIHSQLKHPNIIQILDYFETPEMVVIVTEYCPDGDLSTLIGKVSVETAQVIASNLVSALHFLHSKRILHRDIKPQNVLIGKDNIYKLCDFGIANTIPVDKFLLETCTGTVAYMAPEVFKGKGYNERADLWSLGLLLYVLISGEQSYQLMIAKTREIRWPTYIVGDCLSFLKGLLEINPDKRLAWPNLSSHPFVKDLVLIRETVARNALTKALTQTQQVRKDKEMKALKGKRVDENLNNLLESEETITWDSNVNIVLALIGMKIEAMHLAIPISTESEGGRQGSGPNALTVIAPVQSTIDLRTLPSGRGKEDKTVEKQDKPVPLQAPENPVFALSLSLSHYDKLRAKRIIRRLGGRLTIMPKFDPDCTALVTNTEGVIQEEIETFEECGKLIITIKYIEESSDATGFLPIEEKYIWKEEETE